MRQGILKAAGAIGTVLVAGGAKAGRSSTPEESSVRVVNASAPDLITSPGRLVVDIRAPSEWNQTGVLPEVRLHSFQGADAFLEAFKNEIARGDEIYLICQSGNRSNRAAHQLAQAIDRPVHDVAGGMFRLSRESEALLIAPTAAAGCSTC